MQRVQECTPTGCCIGNELTGTLWPGLAVVDDDDTVYDRVVEAGAAISRRLDRQCRRAQ